MLDLVRRPSDTLGLSTFEEMDRLFDNLWRSVGLPNSSFNLPSVDIYSPDNKHMVVEMQAPGFDPEDIELSIRDNVLEIRGEKSDRQEQDGKRSYMVRESNSSFARRVVLPEEADNENITAELDKGLLKITVPVNRPEAKRIKISGSKAGSVKKLAAKAD